MPFNLIILIIVIAFALTDLITGTIKAFKNRNYNSGKMREGLFHKSTLVLIIGLGWGIEFASQYLELGFTIPLVPVAGVYIILAEIGSILENLCAINPELMPRKLTQIFNSKILDNLNEENEGAQTKEREPEKKKEENKK